MSIEVQPYSITQEDYQVLSRAYQCPYLQLVANYRLENRQVKLFLSTDEITDIQSKIDILHTVSMGGKKDE